MFHLFVMLGTALVVVQLVMLLFWGYYLIRRNVSVVDIGWGIGFIGAALTCFLLGEGYFGRKLLVLIIVSLWALRLVKYLSCRFIPDRDDPRYTDLLTRWPFAGFPAFQAFTLFAFQGLLVAVLSLPFALMCQNILPFFSPYEVFGLLIWMGGLIGEAIADNQLEKFKLDPANANQICKKGLWRFSRHPNYFFEWIIWLGYGVMALSSPLGWLGLTAPLLMLYLLLKVSGIPLAEQQALRTKGEAYRDYQSTTSPFFPWFSRATPKESKDSGLDKQNLS